jgi:hypothetical protein
MKAEVWRQRSHCSGRVSQATASGVAERGIAICLLPSAFFKCYPFSFFLDFIMSVKAAFKILLWIAAVAYALPASAQQASAFKDSNGIVYLYGLPPKSVVEVAVVKPFTRGVVANSCGVLLIKSSDSFSINGETINPNNFNLVTKDVPKNCSDLTGYPTVFKTSSGAIAITGKTPNNPYAVQIPNYKAKRQIVVNDCGFIRLNDKNAVTFNMPTTNGNRADFAIADFPQSKPLSCIKGTLYYPIGFDKQGTVISGSSGTSQGSGGSSGTVSVNPQISRSGNYLIVQNLTTGTYKMANAVNPMQYKNYTVSSSCFVADRTQFGSPSMIMLSGTGIAVPKQYSWTAIATSVNGVLSC